MCLDDNYEMSTAIDVNGVCWIIEPRDGVAKHGRVFLEMVPSLLSNAITGLAASNLTQI